MVKREGKIICLKVYYSRQIELLLLEIKFFIQPKGSIMIMVPMQKKKLKIWNMNDN